MWIVTLNDGGRPLKLDIFHIFSGSVESSTEAGSVNLKEKISAVDPDGLSSTLTYKITPDNTMFSLNNQQGIPIDQCSH